MNYIYKGPTKKYQKSLHNERSHKFRDECCFTIQSLYLMDIEAVLYLVRSNTIRLRPQYLIFICHSSQKK